MDWLLQWIEEASLGSQVEEDCSVVRETSRVFSRCSSHLINL